MCGIAGVIGGDLSDAVSRLRCMLASIRHRGPDEFGIYFDQHAAIGSARLSIIDLAGGQQPIANEDGTLWVVFNGEIFNHVELRPQLCARGHCFRTESDTEVLLHLYEDYGPSFLNYLNGQFAIAIWDTRRRALFLARDRVGVRPLFYTSRGNQIIFGSEIKALLAHSDVEATLDPEAIGQAFTFWSPLSPRTVFRHIVELPPGHYLEACDGKIRVQSYWRIQFDGSDTGRTLDEDAEELQDLLIDATKIRLRADVPVGAYLSGGLDSSTTTAIARRYTPNRLETFSIAFSDPAFDESEFQRQMAGHLGTNHHVSLVTHEDIGRVFPDVVWHAEAPLLRTSPAPMFLLSRLVHDKGLKVVLTGEGADEFLAGYDIFKEAAIRRFWARQPSSEIRPRLFQRLYPDIAGLSALNPAYLAGFFGSGLTDVDCPWYSHAIRWKNNLRTHRFFSADVAEVALKAGSPDAVRLPEAFFHWNELERSQFLEIDIFLSQYLLCSQGDRMAMAHSVEGRFPFLDHRVIEFCNRLPLRRKRKGLTEKYLLKKVGARLLPSAIWQRPKRPYRAPVHRSFWNSGAAYVPDLLSRKSLEELGMFKPDAVSQLYAKLARGHALGETDDMALAGIISTQLLHEQFVSPRRRTPVDLPSAAKIKICCGSEGREEEPIGCSYGI